MRYFAGSRKSRLIATTLLGFLLAAPFALAGEEKGPALPKDLPPYGPVVPLQAPHVEVQKLANGLTLWMVPRPGFPKVSFAIAIKGGMADDPKDRPGLSQLLVSTLDQGTKTRNQREIAEELQAAGGDLTGNAHADSLLAQTSVLASKEDSALAVLADILQNSTFPDEQVALAKRNAADALRAQEAQPGFLAGRAVAKALFGDHPYSVVSPTQESIAKTTAAEIRAEYHRRFRPDHTVLVAVGDFEASSLASTVSRLLGGWANPPGPPASAVSKPAENNPHEVFLIERAGSVQTTFALAGFGPTEHDADFASTEVANAIYGGMFGSRLIKNIREDKGYTYSPHSLVETRAEAGIVETRADVRNAVTGPAFNEIEYELNRLATTAPTEDELTHAKRYLIGLTAIRLQLQERVAAQLAGYWVFGLPPDEIGIEGAAIQRVTASDVASAGRRYFPASRQTVIAVGEGKLIREQLAPFGISVKTAP